MAVFLTSDSATELVQQMTTLDMIADHMNSVVADVAAAQAAAAQAQAEAEPAAATAQAGLDEARGAEGRGREAAAAYQADFERLSTDEQARVTDALAGPDCSCRRTLPLPAGAPRRGHQDRARPGRRPLRRGAAGPDAFDCSGLTMFAFAAAGVTLPHSSRAQSQLGTPVSRADLQPGDLVFFYSPISHVGIYIGGGMMVHARTYGSPVAVTSVDQWTPASASGSADPAPGPQCGRAAPASICTSAVIRLARVAGEAAVCTRQRTAYRLVPSRPSNVARAAGSAASAAARSSGTVTVAGPRRHVPATVGLARLDGWQTAGPHAARAVSSSTASTFFCDHMLFGRRG